MKKFDVIFCVLTYKNHTDLIEFIESLRQNKSINFSYKIIVVNSFADESSLQKIKRIALANECIFIESENKGYGFGNNLGIEYAKQNFIFDYIIVSNPDIIIKQFDIESLKGQDKCIIAPRIIALNGKEQNPLYYKNMPISEKIVFYGMKNNQRLLLYLGIVLNKIDRYFRNTISNLIRRNKQHIYGCHGSFIIFSKNAIDKLDYVFDENIFLFCEESDLAKNANKHNINIIFNKDIVVLHKEDGSMNLSNMNLNNVHRDSYLYYYKKWNVT